MLAAILLAAGEARRMKKLKQILPWKEGLTLVQASLENILACREIDGPVRVVIGAGADLVRENLDKYSDPRLEVHENPDYSRGMITSVKTGLAALPPEVDGFFVALADQPMISPQVYGCLARVFREGEKNIIIPVYQNQRGHPVLLSTVFLDEIWEMPDSPQGLRPLIDRHKEQVLFLELNDPGITIDLDCPEEYFRYRREGE